MCVFESEYSINAAEKEILVQMIVCIRDGGLSPVHLLKMHISLICFIFEVDLLILLNVEVLGMDTLLNMNKIINKVPYVRNNHLFIRLYFYVFNKKILCAFVVFIRI